MKKSGERRFFFFPGEAKVYTCVSRWCHTHAQHTTSVSYRHRLCQNEGEETRTPLWTMLNEYPPPTFFSFIRRAESVNSWCVDCWSHTETLTDDGGVRDGIFIFFPFLNLCSWAFTRCVAVHGTESRLQVACRPAVIHIHLFARRRRRRALLTDRQEKKALDV